MQLIETLNKCQTILLICLSENMSILENKSTYVKLLTGKKYNRFTGTLRISSILKSPKVLIDNFLQSSGETLLNNKLSSV